jgi:hypothetical protein
MGKVLPLDKYPVVCYDNKIININSSDSIQLISIKFLCQCVCQQKITYNRQILINMDIKHELKVNQTKYI